MVMVYSTYGEIGDSWLLFYQHYMLLLCTETVSKNIDRYLTISMFAGTFPLSLMLKNPRSFFDISKPKLWFDVICASIPLSIEHF